MKTLVTGGAGFIGSHVCDRLLAAGHSVIAVDDLSSGNRSNLDARVRLAVEDIRSEATARLIEQERPEAIFHLAAQMDVRRSVEDPRFDADVNVAGFINVLEAARRAKVRKVIFSSTGGAIYGEQERFPAPEEHPTQPVSPYGISKAAGELYLAYYRRQYGLSTVALRYANVYGPRQNPHGEAGVVAIFSQRLVQGKPCVIYGTGRQTRDFVHSSDVAAANLLALESNFSGSVNIGTGVETEINTLYALLARAAGSSAKAEHADAKPGEQLRSCIDAGLAKKVLGWTPAVQLAEGLAQTLAFFREREHPSKAAG